MRLVCVGNHFFAVKYIEMRESEYVGNENLLRTQESRYLDDMYRSLLNREY